MLDPADNAIHHPPALATADALRTIGPTVDLQAMDRSAMVQRRNNRNPPAQSGWNLVTTKATTTGIANPLLTVFSRLCDAAWFGRPCDRRLSQLIDARRSVGGAAKRGWIETQVMRVHREHATSIALGQYRSVIAHRRSLRGLTPGHALFSWSVEKA